MLSGSRRRTLLDVVHSDLNLRCLSRRERLVLGAICLCTLALLCTLQHNRVFFGDEIGTLNYLKESPGYILTHFGTHLSMNYFILVEKGGCVALRSEGLATDYTASDGCYCNNSVDCLAGAQIYGFHTHRADCCELSRV